MPLKLRAGIAGFAVVVAALLAGCGGGSTGGVKVSGKQLVIYSSLPLQGQSRQESLDIVDAERMALAKAGGKAGDYMVRLVSLDASKGADGEWDPGKISANARTAAQDRRTIAYIGELDAGASAVSIPILNQATILEVSPGDSQTGLTRPDGGGKDEPDKFYPTDKRNFGRVVQSDHVQADAIATYMKEAGVTKVFLLNDEEAYGIGLAGQVSRSAKDQSIAVVGNEGVRPGSKDFASLAAKIARSAATAVFFGMSGRDGRPELFKAIHAADPTLGLYGSHVMATSKFLTGLGPAAQRTFITQPTLDSRLYPPAGQEFYRDFKAKFGHDPQPMAIFGYEAMGALLAAIDKAGKRGNDRQAVIDAFFGLKNRESVLGTYSIDDNGDTTRSEYGGYKVVGGRLVFDKALRSPS